MCLTGVATILKPCATSMRGCAANWGDSGRKVQRKVLTEAGDEIHLNEALQEAREVGSYELFIRANRRRRQNSKNSG